jgi:hypothetical protein
MDEIDQREEEQPITSVFAKAGLDIKTSAN